MNWPAVVFFSCFLLDIVAFSIYYHYRKFNRPWNCDVCGVKKFKWRDKHFTASRICGIACGVVEELGT